MRQASDARPALSFTSSSVTNPRIAVSTLPIVEFESAKLHCIDVREIVLRTSAYASYILAYRKPMFGSDWACFSRIGGIVQGFV